MNARQQQQQQIEREARAAYERWVGAALYSGEQTRVWTNAAGSTIERWRPPVWQQLTPSEQERWRAVVRPYFIHKNREAA